MDAPQAEGITWPGILAHWPLIICDFQQFYHLELEAVLTDRSQIWLKTRILGLLSWPESRIKLTLFPPKKGG